MINLAAPTPELERPCRWRNQFHTGALGLCAGTGASRISALYSGPVLWRGHFLERLQRKGLGAGTGASKTRASSGRWVGLAGCRPRLPAARLISVTRFGAW